VGTISYPNLYEIQIDARQPTLINHINPQPLIQRSLLTIVYMWCMTC